MADAFGNLLALEDLCNLLAKKFIALLA